MKTIKKAKIENEEDMLRIRREIHIMSSLQHPHIIHIHEGKCKLIPIILKYDYAFVFYIYSSMYWINFYSKDL